MIKILHFLTTYWYIVYIVVNEIIRLSPLKANGVIQAVWSIIVFIVQKILKVPSGNGS